MPRHRESADMASGRSRRDHDLRQLGNGVAGRGHRGCRDRHGAPKSVAAAHFPRLAAARGLAVGATAAGTEPRRGAGPGGGDGSGRRRVDCGAGAAAPGDALRLGQRHARDELRRRRHPGPRPAGRPVGRPGRQRQRRACVRPDRGQRRVSGGLARPRPRLDHHDARFKVGRLGLWTKADSITAFDDLEAVAR